MTAPTVICLCCGTLHAADGDCPNALDSDHNGRRAYAVAKALLAQGIEYPTPGEVIAALAGLDNNGSANELTDWPTEPEREEADA